VQSEQSWILAVILIYSDCLLWRVLLRVSSAAHSLAHKRIVDCHIFITIIIIIITALSAPQMTLNRLMRDIPEPVPDLSRSADGHARHIHAVLRRSVKQIDLDPAHAGDHLQMRRASASLLRSPFAIADVAQAEGALASIH